MKRNYDVLINSFVATLHNCPAVPTPDVWGARAIRTDGNPAPRNTHSIRVVKTQSEIMFFFLLLSVWTPINIIEEEYPERQVSLKVDTS